MDARTRIKIPAFGFSPARIWAMILRYLYLLRSSWPRTLELVYWPTLQMIVWGFMSQFMTTHSTLLSHAFGVLLAAVLLWDVFFRGQLGVSISFLEEIWSRNLGHLFASPLRPSEWLVSMLAMSLVRVAIGVFPAALLAWWLYGYDILTMGLPLAGFFMALIIMGWSIGLMVSAVVLLQGLGAEGLAWFAAFGLSPVSAVYYPVSVLPHWLQPVAWALPSAHVFEGMRAVVFGGPAAANVVPHLIWAFALDAAYLALGFGVFLTAFDAARRKGALLQTGE